MRQLISLALLVFLFTALAAAQKYTAPDGKLRIALVKQPFSPTGTSVGPNTMANGGIQQMKADFRWPRSIAFSKEQSTE